MFLTDANYIILHLLRSRTDVDQDVRYATRERFPTELARPIPDCLIDMKDASSLEKLVQTVNELLLEANGPWNADKPVGETERPSVVAALSTVFGLFSILALFYCFFCYWQRMVRVLLSIVAILLV